MPIRDTIDMFIFSSELNQKVVWIALISEHDQQFCKNPTIPPGQRIDPNMGLTPIPFMSGLIYLTPSLYDTLLVNYSVSNLTYPFLPRTNQIMNQGRSLTTQAMLHGQQ